MGNKAVRLGDNSKISGDSHGCNACPHTCVGPFIGGSGNVFINSLPAIRKGDPGIHAVCCGPNMYKANQGSDNVFTNSKAQVRLDDETKHCGGSGKTIAGSANVLVN
jgi:uncharacterized Zn-binding protein involved in type VI secretion